MLQVSKSLIHQASMLDRSVYEILYNKDSLWEFSEIMTLLQS